MARNVIILLVVCVLVVLVLTGCSPSYHPH
jgi:hypothetical protein